MPFGVAVGAVRQGEHGVGESMKDCTRRSPSVGEPLDAGTLGGDPLRHRPRRSRDTGSRVGAGRHRSPSRGHAARKRRLDSFPRLAVTGGSVRACRDDAAATAAIRRETRLRAAALERHPPPTPGHPGRPEKKATRATLS